MPHVRPPSIAACHSLGGLRLIVQQFTLNTQGLQAAYDLRLHFTLAASQSRRITPLSAPGRLRAPLDRLCARARGSNARDEETSCEAGSEEAILSVGDQGRAADEFPGRDAPDPRS